MPDGPHDPAEEARSIADKGIKLWHGGDPKSALDCFERAVALVACQPDVAAEVQINFGTNHALCLAEVGDYSAAEELYAQLAMDCGRLGVVNTTVIRQWAKLKEQTGQFIEARKLYEQVEPRSNASRREIISWHNAVGIINWREGRILDARMNFHKSTSAILQQSEDADIWLSALGNDALLSYELDDEPRAMRLVTRMHDIKAKCGNLSLSNEICLIRIEATRALRCRDYRRESAVWREGIALIKARAPDDWPRRFDLTCSLVEALERLDARDEAIKVLTTVLVSAPNAFSFVPKFYLAKLQLRSGDLERAQQNLNCVVASCVGESIPLGEIEIVFELARLADAHGACAAAILLGKMALADLSEATRGFEGEEQRAIIRNGREIAMMLTNLLISEGRFSEADTLSRLEERVRLLVQIKQNAPLVQVSVAPVPFRQSEIRARDNWLSNRKKLAMTREEASQDVTDAKAAQMIEDMLGFKGRHPSVVVSQAAVPLEHGVVRLSYTFGQNAGTVQCSTANDSRSVAIDVPMAKLNQLISELRTNLSEHAAWIAPAQKLFGYLIAPFTSDISAAGRLEIDATGPFSHIPFALLTNGEVCLTQMIPMSFCLGATPPLASEPVNSDLVHMTSAVAGPLSRTPRWMADTWLGSLKPCFVKAEAFTRSGLVALLETHPRFLSIATHLDSEPARPDLWALTLGDGDDLYLSELGSRQFDFSGIEVVCFATCGSAISDDGEGGGHSLAWLALEKGADTVIGTLWDISESAAAHFIETFWPALAIDPENDPVLVLAELQAAYAQAALRPVGGVAAAGGIGAAPLASTPVDWAAFAVFRSRNRNSSQPAGAPNKRLSRSVGSTRIKKDDRHRGL